MHHRLNSTDIDTGLKKLTNWTPDTYRASICKGWEFDSFKTAMRFFVQVGELAEMHNHHPEFLSNYTKVSIRLTTHDAHGLTDKDVELAMQIDQLVQHEFRDLLKQG